MRLRRPLAHLLFATHLCVSAAACAPQTVACDDVCACAGTPGPACIARCVQGQSDEKRAAAAAHCDQAYADYSRCESDNAICDASKKVYTYPSGVCDPLLTTYQRCAHLPSGATAGSTGAASTGTGG